jgi:hypothetical protein
MVRRLVCLVATTQTITNHVFVCHSGAPYKSHAFLGVIAAHDGPTTLLATSSCRNRFDAVGDRAITSVVAFASTFSSVSLRRLFGSLPRLWTLAGEMAALLEAGSRCQRVLAFIPLAVEQAKYLGLAGCANGVRSLHTYSPMPYLLQAVSAEDICVYQQGIQAETAGQRSSFVVPRHAPVRHLIWSVGWSGEFERKAHPKSPIHAVGSPRFDRLLDRRDERDVEYDVLFVSGTEILGDESADETAYRRLVEAVVETCAARGWSPAIKLHPIERPRYYEQWAYEEYIVLGTLMVVAQQSMDLEKGGFCDVAGVSFPASLEEAVDDLVAVKRTTVPVADIIDSGLLRVDDSVPEIRDLVEG